jgi:hypothetical protein
LDNPELLEEMHTLQEKVGFGNPEFWDQNWYLRFLFFIKLKLVFIYWYFFSVFFSTNFEWMNFLFFVSFVLIKISQNM